MTRVVGNDGAATIAGHGGKINTWSSTFTQNVSNVSAFADVWRQNRGGMYGGTVSLTAVMEFAAANSKPNITPLPDGADLVLTAAPSCTFTGKAVLTSIPISSDANGDASLGYDGEWTGVVAEAWDETPPA